MGCMSKGSTCRSRASSPGSSIQSVIVGDYELDNLPVIWDDIAAVRERIRENSNLCLAIDPECGAPKSIYVDATTENVRLNSFVLETILKIMKHHEWQLPGISCLITAIEKFYLLAKLPRTRDQAYQEAWAIRRLIGKVKKIMYRPTPPQDCHSMVHAAINQQFVQDNPMQFYFDVVCCKCFPSILSPITLYRGLLPNRLCRMKFCKALSQPWAWTLRHAGTYGAGRPSSTWSWTNRLSIYRSHAQKLHIYVGDLHFISSIRSCANCYHGTCHASFPESVGQLLSWGPCRQWQPFSVAYIYNHGAPAGFDMAASHQNLYSNPIKMLEITWAFNFHKII